MTGIPGPGGRRGYPGPQVRELALCFGRWPLSDCLFVGLFVCLSVYLFSLRGRRVRNIGREKKGEEREGGRYAMTKVVCRAPYIFHAPATQAMCLSV